MCNKADRITLEKLTHGSPAIFPCISEKSLYLCN